MTLALPDGMTLGVEIALTSAVGPAAVWDSSYWDDDSGLLGTVAVWGTGEEFQDISQYVISVSTDRHFGDGIRTWAAGTASIVLTNTDGRFSPDNTAATAPYVVGGVSTIRPGAPIRVWVEYDGLRYHLFRGVVQVWSENVTGLQPTSWTVGGLCVDTGRVGDATVQLSCVDEWERLSQVSSGVVPAGDGAGETFGPRISRLLSAAGHTSPSGVVDRIDVGLIPVVATTSDSPTEQIAVAAFSEAGSVFIDGDGAVFALDRYSIIEDTRTTIPMATFGDGGGVEINWSDMQEAPMSVATVINRASYTSTEVGAVTQTYSDVVSESLYGTRMDRSSYADKIICQDDGDVYSLAQWTVFTAKDPGQKVESVTIRPRCDPAVILPVVLELRMRDLIEVKRRPPANPDWAFTMTRSCFVSGIKYEINSGDIVVTISTEDATQYRRYAASVWDTGTWGASATDTTGALWFL